MLKQKKKNSPKKNAVKYERKGCAEFRAQATLPQPIRSLFFSIIKFRCPQVLGKCSFLEWPLYYQWNAECYGCKAAMY